MNKILYILLLLAVVGCGNYSREQALKSLDNTVIEIEDPERHYYPIVRGSKLFSTFKFYNRGENPLILKEVHSSCGCIVVDYPENLINPGDFGYINIEYNSNKNIGYVEGFIDIYANLESLTKETIKFDVNVVTNADYTHDYEERYSIFLEEQRANALEEGVEGGTTQQGYFIELGGEMKY